MVIRQDDVVSTQLFAERSHEDDIRIGVDATVLVQNIRSPCVTDARQPCHVLSVYLYHIRARTNIGIWANQFVLGGGLPFLPEKYSDRARNKLLI